MPTPTPSDDAPAISQQITEEDTIAYAVLTADANPIHLDEVFAATTPFESRIAHGTLSLALVWKLVAKMYAGRSLVGFGADVAFRSPAFIGQWIEARHVGGSLESGDLAIEVRHPDGEVILSAEIQRRG